MHLGPVAVMNSTKSCQQNSSDPLPAQYRWKAVEVQACALQDTQLIHDQPADFEPVNLEAEALMRLLIGTDAPMPPTKLAATHQA